MAKVLDAIETESRDPLSYEGERRIVYSQGFSN